MSVRISHFIPSPCSGGNRSSFGHIEVQEHGMVKELLAGWREDVTRDDLRSVNASATSIYTVYTILMDLVL